MTSRISRRDNQKAPEQRFEDFQARIELPMLVISLLIIPVIVLPLVEDLSPWSERTLAILGVVIWVAFAAEYIGLMALSTDRKRTFRTHKLELLLVAMPFLRPLRIFQVVRLAQAGAGFTKALKAARAIGLRPGFGSVLGTVGGLIALGGGLVAIAENDQPGSTIESLADGLWWALVTCTTVGYGDEFPVTSTGRFIAVILMLAGISGLSVITANVAAYFVSTDGDDNDDGDSLADRLTRIEAQLGDLTRMLAEGDRPPT